MDPEQKEWRRGSCHCQMIQFEVLIPSSIDVYKCNCSICWMKQNHHFVVSDEEFRLFDVTATTAENSNRVVMNNYSNAISVYKFNTQTASHKFCKICGICSFYTPRSNPNGKAITIYCMEDYQQNGHRLKVNWKNFDGVHWEASICTSDITAKTKKSVRDSSVTTTNAYKNN